MWNSVKSVTAGSVATALLLGARLAAAQVPATQAEDGYGYNFADDPLNAGGFGANDARIRVRPPPARITLIRPRTSFVPEMLKSVEHM
jgi:hypothetical protein